MPKKPAEKKAEKKNEKSAKARKAALPKVSQSKGLQPKMQAKKPLVPAPKPTKAPQAPQYYYAAGKRKTSIARVKLFQKKETRGTVSEVNKRPLEEYFPLNLQQQIIFSPLKITDQIGNFDVSVNVQGGGPMSQAEAIRHGISRALLDYDPALRLPLKRAGFLTRDSRIKERKKYGLHRARRGPQFSKR